MTTTKTLIRNAVIVFPNHDLNGLKRDVLVEKGIITQIDKKISPSGKFQEISSKNLHLSIGWFDLKAHFGQPGYEERETLSSGSNAAAAGGFTSVAILPSNQPSTDNKAAVEFIKQFGKNALVELFPYGCISQNGKGKDLAEMYDMNSAGAIGFTDDLNHIQNPKLLQLAVEYCKDFHGLVVSTPLNKDIAGKGMVNEGEFSTHLGLKGIPHFAEEINVSRDIKIAEYTEAKLHFTGISSAESLKMIASAKKNGRKVTCDVSSHLLLHNDDVLKEFDSNYKVMPPIRTEKDRKALIKGVNEGKIDAVTSDHRPQNIENKDCEFELASFGMIGIQTVFSDLVEVGFSPETIVEQLALGPRRITSIEIPSIQIGAKANLTCFDPSLEWIFLKENNLSRSENSPLIGHSLKGKVIAVLNNGKIHVND